MSYALNYLRILLKKLRILKKTIVSFLLLINFHLKVKQIMLCLAILI